MNIGPEIQLRVFKKMTATMTYAVNPTGLDYL